MKTPITRFDRIIWIIIASLALAIGFLAFFSQEQRLEVIAITTLADPPPVNTTIQIQFSEAPDMNSVEAHFSIDPPVAGSFAAEGTRAIFTPQGFFSPRYIYTVRLAAGVLSAKGAHKTQDAAGWAFQPLPSAIFLAPTNEIVRSLWLQSVTENAAPVEIFASAYGIYDYALHPQGNQIALALYDENRDTDIWLVAMDGSGLTRITNCLPDAVCTTPTWSPDGNLVAYERQEIALGGGLGPKRIWVYDLEKRENRRIFEDSQVLGYGAVWSPVGRTIAFYDANVQSIRVMDLNSGEQRMLFSQLWEISSFSADGQKLVYSDIRQVERGFYPQIWVADLNSEGVPELLVSDPQEDQSPIWSPDGVWVVFSRRNLDWQRDWGSQVTLYNTQSGELRQITSDTIYNNAGYRWDMSSRYLLIQRYNLKASRPSTELWVYDLQTDELSLFTGDGFDGRWLP